jgi:hypothetical protein
MRTILLSLALGAIVFALFLGRVQARAQEAPRPSPPPAALLIPPPAPPAAVVLEEEEEDEAIEARPLSRIDPLWSKTLGVGERSPAEYRYFSRAGPKLRPKKPVRIN